MNLGRILVVDNEDSSRFTMADYFSSVGYVVEEASDGEDALQKFVPGKFDCVISDLSIPKVGGLELLKKVRRQDRDVSFLIVAGYHSAVSAMKEGACDYVTKPFHMDDIQLKVSRALHIKKTEASLKKSKSLSLSLIVLMPVVVSAGVILGMFLKAI